MISCRNTYSQLYIVPESKRVYNAHSDFERDSLLRTRELLNSMMTDIAVTRASYPRVRLWTGSRGDGLVFIRSRVYMRVYILLYKYFYSYLLYEAIQRERCDTWRAAVYKMLQLQLLLCRQKSIYFFFFYNISDRKIRVFFMDCFWFFLINSDREVEETWCGRALYPYNIYIRAQHISMIIVVCT